MGGGHFSKYSVGGYSTWQKGDPIRFKVCKNEGWKDLRPIKNVVNWIENQGENWYKMLKIPLYNTFQWQTRPTLGPIISGMNLIEKNLSYLQKERVAQVEA